MGDGFDGAGDDGADGFLGESGGGWVDGFEAGEVVPCSFNFFEFGVFELEAATVAPDAPGEDQLVALAESAGDEWHVPPEDGEGGGAVGDEASCAADASSDAKFGDVEQFADDGLEGGGWLEFGDAAEVGVVVEAAGEEQDCVAEGGDAELFESVGDAAGDAGEVVEG